MLVFHVMQRYLQLLILASLIVVAFAQAQEAPQSHSSKGSTLESQQRSNGQLSEVVSTGNVQCDQNWLSSRSPTVLSPTGIRVFVEVRAKSIIGRTKDDNRCLTTWLVHISVGTATKTFVAGRTDDDWFNEHYFEINGWSSDGHLLLLSMVTAAGDWDSTTPVIFDTQKNRIWRVELTKVFDEHTPKDCSLYFRPLGFDIEGRVLLDVGALDSDDLPDGEKPCFAQSKWELNYVRKTVKKVSPNTSFQRLGSLINGK